MQAGFCFASSYCGNIICKVLLCRKLLREYNFEAPVLCQAIAEFQFAGLALHQALEEFTICKALFCPKLLGHYGDSGSSYLVNRRNQFPMAVHRTLYILSTPFMWRFRFIVDLKCAPSSGDSGSSQYTFSTPLTWRVRFIIFLKPVTPLMWRSKFIRLIQRTPSCGTSRSS